MGSLGCRRSRRRQGLGRSDADMRMQARPASRVPACSLLHGKLRQTADSSGVPACSLLHGELWRTADSSGVPACSRLHGEAVRWGGALRGSAMGRCAPAPAAVLPSCSWTCSTLMSCGNATPSDVGGSLRMLVLWGAGVCWEDLLLPPPPRSACCWQHGGSSTLYWQGATYLQQLPAWQPAIYCWQQQQPAWHAGVSSTPWSAVSFQSAFMCSRCLTMTVRREAARLAKAA